MPDEHCDQRTDSVEEKLRLLGQAHRAGNRDIAMSLAESIKDTLSFERQSHGGEGELTVGADVFGRVTDPNGQPLAGVTVGNTTSRAM